MAWVFLCCAVVVTAWFTVFMLARSGGARENERVRRETREAVRRSIGLEIDGNPIGSYTMQGNVHAVDMSIDGSTTLPLPGTSSDDRLGATAITVRVALPDQIVCRKSDVDKVMGLLPSLPSRATGDPRFDAQFAVMVDASAMPEQSAGYRDAPAVVLPLAWTDPKTLGDLIAQHLIFLRLRDGVCQIAFRPTPAGEIAPLVATAANVVRRASGQPLVAPAASTFIAPQRSFDSVTKVMPIALGFILFAPAGTVLGFLPPLRDLNAEAECGKGSEIRVSSSDGDDGGTSYGLYCWKDGSADFGAPLIGHHLSAIALYFALVFGIFTLIGLRRWPTKARAY